jgi:integrase
MGLGPFPDVTLAEARDRARQIKRTIWDGQDPKAARAVGMNFEQAMNAFLPVKLAELSNPKAAAQWRSTLSTYALPVFGRMSVADISVQDVRRALAPIWETKTETASRLRGRIEAVLAWAATHGHREGDNPARWKGNLDTTLPKPSKVAKVAHHPALALGDAADWMIDLQGRNGIATRALEFMALTAARSGEVRGAVWSEIDLKAAIWTIPANRMKAGKEHRVPLPEDTLILLSDLPRMSGSDQVFPAARGGALSDMALSACMKRISEARQGGGYVDTRSGRSAVPHGLRSTFRDWAAERGVDRDMAEIALAHSVGSEVERAYRRSDMLDRRRALMEAWSRFLYGKEGTVVSLEATGA